MCNVDYKLRALGTHFASFNNIANMGEFKHLVIVKFKQDVVVEEILTGLEKLVAEIDAVKSYEW